MKLLKILKYPLPLLMLISACQSAEETGGRAHFNKARAEFERGAGQNSLKIREFSEARTSNYYIQKSEEALREGDSIKALGILLEGVKNGNYYTLLIRAGKICENSGRQIEAYVAYVAAIFKGVDEAEEFLKNLKARMRPEDVKIADQYISDAITKISI